MQYAKCQKCGKEAVHTANEAVDSFTYTYETLDGEDSDCADDEVFIENPICILIEICMECLHVSRKWIE